MRDYVQGRVDASYLRLRIHFSGATRSTMIVLDYPNMFAYADRLLVKGSSM